VPSTAPAAAATADAASDPAAASNSQTIVNLAVDLCTVEGLRGAFGDTDVFVHARVVDELSDSVVLEARSAVCRRERVCAWTPPHAFAFAAVRRGLTLQLILYDRDDLVWSLVEFVLFLHVRRKLIKLLSRVSLLPELLIRIHFLTGS
jgi:hypothetical protein